MTITAEEIPKTINDWVSSSINNRASFVKYFFKNLSTKNIDLVDLFYEKNAVLIDPVGVHKSRDNIKDYYRGIYSPVTEINFEFTDAIEKGNIIVISWKMIFKSSKLRSGKKVEVEGLSKISFNPESNLVVMHRDYFDMGEMVYEHIPVLSGVIKWLKNKLK